VNRAAMVQTNLRTPASSSTPRVLLQRHCACGTRAAAGAACAECGRKKAALQSASSGALQRSCACGSHTAGGEECEHCKAPKESSLQTKLEISAPGDTYEREADRVAAHIASMPETPALVSAPIRLQRVTRQSSSAETSVPRAVHQTLADAGRPLESGVRRDMELRFGYDFSGVRVHSDDGAGRSARSVAAAAYTVGAHVVFAPGQYQPHTLGGRTLLAHELAHTIQQSAAGQVVQRTPCGHDAQKTNCRAELGVLKLRDVTGKVGQMISIDRWVADDGLRHYFAGQWAAQLMTPLNPLKEGEDRGFIDATRVTDGSTLGLEITEIKARSPQGGGCSLATTQARGYMSALGLIKAQVLAISAGLAAQGGVRVPSDRCRRPKAAERGKLERAGVNFADETSMLAWCFLNSLQDRLNKTYTTPFTEMKMSLFADGDSKQTYPVWPPMRIDCPKVKGRRRMGWTFLEFQVNKKGGVSYGCRDECFSSEEEEKRRTQELVKEQELRKRQTTAPRETVPSEMFVDRPEQEDLGEDQPPVKLPEGGVPIADVIAAGGAAVTTVALLHQAAKSLKDIRQLEAARSAALKALAEARAKGAYDVARKLNSDRLAKQFGTKAYDQTVKGTATALEKEALKDAGFIAKYGSRGARFLGRVAGILGVLMLAKDAAAAVSHISKGGTIDIGLKGMDASLEGKTDVDVSGPTGKQDVLGEVTLKDTQIDIETKGFPSVSGSVNLKAEKLTVRGPAGDGDATINFTAKYKNTKITIRHDGQIKGGKLTMQGGSEISDSDLEIDLPPGVDLSKRADPGKATVIKGAKIKITEVSAGGGGGAGGTAKGAGAGSGTDVQPGTEETPATGSAEKGTPGQAGTAGQAGAPATTGRNLTDLLLEVQQSTGLRTLYAGLVGKDDGVPVTEGMLRRLVDLKSAFDRHPGAVQEILAGLKPAQITDPIKQIIEPIEEKMRQADQKLAKAREKAIADAKSKTAAGKTPPPKPTEEPEKPSRETKGAGAGAGKGTGRAGDINLADVRDVRLVDLLNVLENPGQPTKEKNPPKHTDVLFVWRVKVDQSELVYHISAPATRVQVLTPGPRQNWRGKYKLRPPTGIVLSTQGDMPIRFTDTGEITTEIYSEGGAGAGRKP
jgi:hypothetical protein